MNDRIAKSISTLGVWGETAAILIWSRFTTAAPAEIFQSRRGSASAKNNYLNFTSLALTFPHKTPKK